MNRYLAVLAVLFLLSFYMRTLSINDGVLLDYDPVFQYRFTKYFVQWGFLPVWDELTYYPGRLNTNPPLMFYLTGILARIFSWVDLKTVAAYSSALYGALILIPAYLLARELSDERGGLLAAAFVGFAPQILSRTFGSSYDTDQLVLFFMLLTLYLGFRFLKSPSIKNFSLAFVGFVAFMATWQMFWVSFFLLLGSVFLSCLLKFLPRLPENPEAFGRKQLTWLGALFLLLFPTGFFLSLSPVSTLLGFFAFAINPYQWIVNISIAELQTSPFTDITLWIRSAGGFTTGGIENIVLAFFILLVPLLLVRRFFREGDLKSLSLVVALMVVALVLPVIKGVRFTIFSSAIILTLVGASLPLTWRKESIKPFTVGAALFLAFSFMASGFYLAPILKPSENPDWSRTWDFLRNETPELALVGTWWDPGHMITGYGERRVIADGAHCGSDCLYGINQRIMDLGKVLVTSSEDEVIEILKRYRGTSPELYWIASEDLIAKFPWAIKFGTGKDAPSYVIMTPTAYTGEKVVFSSGRDSVSVYLLGVPVPVLDGYGDLFREVWFYDDSGNFRNFTFNDTEAVEKALGKKLSGRIINATVYIREDWRYAVVIFPNLRDSLFTKMFFLDGKGLKKFKPVLLTDTVKVYELPASAFESRIGE